MSKELCPYCGSETWHIEHFINPYEFYGACNGCGSQGPRKPTEAEAVAAWNRRYVCPDKDGKPVYAGDKVAVKASNTEYASTGKAELLACVPINGLPVPLDYVQELAGEEDATVEIELIESESEEWQQE